MIHRTKDKKNLAQLERKLQKVLLFDPVSKQYINSDLFICTIALGFHLFSTLQAVRVVRLNSLRKASNCSKT